MGYPEFLINLATKALHYVQPYFDVFDQKRFVCGMKFYESSDYANCVQTAALNEGNFERTVRAFIEKVKQYMNWKLTPEWELLRNVRLMQILSHSLNSTSYTELWRTCSLWLTNIWLCRNLCCRIRPVSSLGTIIEQTIDYLDVWIPLSILLIICIRICLV